MWARAKKQLAKYPEGVLSALDARGYPLSVRQTALAYDAGTGELPVRIPAALEPVEGPANLLCHFHDDKLWNMHMVQLKGRIERRGEGWHFVTTAFDPPSGLEQVRRISRSANAYLARRSLPRPTVPFDVIDALWERAKKLT